MKLFLLNKVAKRFQEFKSLDYIKRIYNNELLVCFDKEHFYQIDLSPSNSFIYRRDNNITEKSIFKAPFDLALQSKISNSTIVNVEVFSNDRVLKFTLEKKLSYKKIISFLQLEFTGKHTNAILLDEKNIIIDALKHLDKKQTFRIIAPNLPLLDLPKFQIKEKVFQVDDIDVYLNDMYKKRSEQKINALREICFTRNIKKLKTVQTMLKGLKSKKELEELCQLWNKKAQLVLMNPDKIDIYKASVKLEDIVIDIPKNTNSVYQISEYCFKKSKKAKSTLQNLQIQKENLQQKEKFLLREQELIKESEDFSHLSIINNVKKRNNKKTFCEEYHYQGYKILIGRNSNENAKILKASKKDDVWMHIRDFPSSHVLVVSKKQQIPMSVLQQSARLCVDMSMENKGNFVVDYTFRRYVKVQSGSNVLYTHQKSIHINNKGK